MLTDAHAHLSGPGELSHRAHTRTLFCGTDPQTAAQILALQGDNALLCCGVHPWHAQKVTPGDMLPFIRQSAALGEIGLDSVWTDADMDVQRRVFVEQLEIAEALRMPVILHTKGMEGEIERILRSYTVPKLVHWYACERYLEDYIAQGCWFTLGPDYESNPAVQAVLRRVPPDRILTETDGVDALAWALKRPVAADEIEEILRGELRAIAAVHGICEAEAEQRVSENLDRFLTGGKSRNQQAAGS